MSFTQIGPYRIADVIGTGGMGTVYLGQHVETGEEVAVKVLSSSYSREEALIARFEREIEALKKLNSPYIVEFYASGVEKEIYWYSMEYVNGETLSDCLERETRIPWQKVIELSLQICKALKAAHDAGVIHRDLKPSNLMLTKDGQFKLTDFGVAQVFATGKLTKTGGVIGTVEYMSPEQAQGKRVTKISDLYALGAVMYVMLTGRPPFTGGTSVEIMQKHQYGRFDEPNKYVSEIPYWLNEIVVKLLSKKPEDRFPDAYVLSLRLKEVQKKIALSLQDRTRTSEKTNGSFHDTIELNQDRSVDFSGTMMRDLVKNEVMRENEPSRVRRIFGSTIMLVAMLIIVIVGGFYWFREKPLLAKQKFEAGIAIMQRAESEDWLKARDDYFLPLIESDSQQGQNEKWQIKVQPYLNRIAVYSLKRDLLSSAKRNRESIHTNEIHRLLQQALRALQIGNTFLAHRTLTALSPLIADGDRFRIERELVRQILEEVKPNDLLIENRRKFVSESLQKAKRLYGSGEKDRARKICESLLDLYGTDSSVHNVIGKVKQLLAEIEKRKIE